MTIHRSHPDADGNPQRRAVCGKDLGASRSWRKSHTPDCPDCNRMTGQGTPNKQRAKV